MALGAVGHKTAGRFAYADRLAGERSYVARGMDMNKMMQQVQQMQAEMAKAQEELAHETVEASVGGGMVTVKASGAGEIVEIKISKEAIDPDDAETLEDLVLAGVNEALRSAQDLMQSRLGGAMGGLGGLGLPGL
jgi:nucleoid-associated protein EbfC